ncbi:sigma-54 dependent transcriptional regulator [Vibrio sp.]|uniref:Sigma-54-dependent Fis family transcriptional regulator n=1 Tax=Vibrio viridaestus TaxID=2487322 RepID=A0A3N9TIG4_9VIBR|nr:sigma-54 dependent transcriptional regulator [Vibrio viridaestus]MDC0611049.1 sigma-54 dependent transcriptional regulator [Vibrio sp.]RQW64098.1 sigma-54-dependent Fis family transcriptional regulator [Vibrio viridaestus]
MQGLAKLLVIEDDSSIRQQLQIILEFIGESCEVIDSTDVDSINWSESRTGCILGSVKSGTLTGTLEQNLHKASHVPLLCLSDQPYSLDCFTNYVGELDFPLNYPQVTDALSHCRAFLGRRNGTLFNSGRKNTLFRSLVGQSTGIQEVRHLIEQVSGSDANVLVLGESGTGKEVVARNIHYHSTRRGGPFVPINCGAIPAELLESELFGHEKGAFTGALNARKGRFELADGGTLFLDEIGDMPMTMQVKLLRVLQERTFERVGGNNTIKVNVRVVAATHRNLESMIEDGGFREDLFYRLNVFPIEMPALKERVEDIPLLIQELLTRMQAEGAPKIGFTPRAINSLMEHSWPGNVRELANLVERMIILFPNSLVDVNHLPTKYRYSDIPEFHPENNSAIPIEEQERELLAGIFSDEFDVDGVTNLDDVVENSNTPQSLPPEGVNLKELLAELEVNLINQALDAQGGVVARAADMLGMRRTTLVEKMRKYNMQR